LSGLRKSLVQQALIDNLTSSFYGPSLADTVQYRRLKAEKQVIEPWNPAASSPLTLGYFYADQPLTLNGDGVKD
jgi:hypothetical protein